MFASGMTHLAAFLAGFQMKVFQSVDPLPLNNANLNSE